MSINSRAKNYSLKKLIETKTASGALKKEWKLERVISVTISKLEGYLNTENIRYKETTHTGLTHYKDISSGEYKLEGFGRAFNILDVNSEGRLTVLKLKELELWG